MSPNPPTGEITWAHVAPLAQWTVPAVLAALSAFEDGDFEQGAMLAEAMLRDPQISGDLAARVRKIASRSALPFAVEPSDEGDGRRRQAVADLQAALWWAAHPESTIAAVQRDTVMCRVSVGWIQWFRSAVAWAPKLHHLPLHGLRYHDTDKTLRYTDGEGTEHIVTPGDGRWFLHMPDGPRSWLMGAIRALGIPFALDPLTLRGLAQFCQRHSIPTLVVEEPFRSSDDVEKTDGSAAAFYQTVNRGLKGGILRAPQPQDKDDRGWKAYWLELQSRSYTSFGDLLTELRRRKSMALTGHDSEKQTSLGGDGEAGARILDVEYLANDAETLSTSLRDQVWKPWARFNHGDENLAAWGRWTTRPPADLSARATTLETAGKAMALLEAQGVDTDPLVAELGLKRRPGWTPSDPSKLPPPPAKNPEAA